MATAAVSQPPSQPDIAYAPDFDKYRARSQRRLVAEKLQAQALPAEFPSKLESDFVWDGESIKEAYQWVYQLGDDDIREIEEALKHFKCS